MTKDEAKELARQVLDDPDVVVQILADKDLVYTISIRGRQTEVIPRKAEMKQT